MYPCLMQWSMRIHCWYILGYTAFVFYLVVGCSMMIIHCWLIKIVMSVHCWLDELLHHERFFLDPFKHGILVVVVTAHSKRLCHSHVKEYSNPMQWRSRDLKPQYKVSILVVLLVKKLLFCLNKWKGHYNLFVPVSQSLVPRTSKLLFWKSKVRISNSYLLPGFFHITS